jgi:hypothetical protein
LSSNRSRAFEILAREAHAVVAARLKKEGYELAMTPLESRAAGVFFYRESVSFGGCRVAEMSFFKSQLRHSTVTATVVTGTPAFFTTEFALHQTASPRRAASLIVQFLRKDLVKSIHGM